MKQFGWAMALHSDSFLILQTQLSFFSAATRIPYLRHEHDQSFFFDFGEVSPGEMVNGAELRIYKQSSEKWAKSEFSVEVFRIRQGQDPEQVTFFVLGSIVIS